MDHLHLSTHFVYLNLSNPLEAEYQEDRIIYNALDNMVNRLQTPASAARQVDTIVTNIAKQALKRYLDVPVNPAHHILSSGPPSRSASPRTVPIVESPLPASRSASFAMSRRGSRANVFTRTGTSEFNTPATSRSPGPRRTSTGRFSNSSSSLSSSRRSSTTFALSSSTMGPSRRQSATSTCLVPTLQQQPSTTSIPKLSTSFTRSQLNTIPASPHPLSGAARPADTAIFYPPHHRDTAEIMPDLENAPDPRAWQHFLWECVAHSGTVLPPNHKGQDALVQFLVALTQLPTKVLKGRPTNDVDEALSPTQLPSTGADGLENHEFWLLSRANSWDGLADVLVEVGTWLRREAELIEEEDVTGAPAAASDEPDATIGDLAVIRQQYVNLQAFIARLLGAGVVDVSSLQGFEVAPDEGYEGSPVSETGPVRSLSDAEKKKIEIEMIASAQWIFYAGDVLFALCESGAEAGATRWQKNMWTAYKQRFEILDALDQKLSEYCMDCASHAKRMMETIEKKGPEKAGAREKASKAMLNLGYVATV